MQFSEENFHQLCDHLYRIDNDLAGVHDQHGYPPMWTRPATFQTLILTILEQQVSLASAYAAFKKLKERIGTVTPEKILLLSDEELRACYFSRQKIVYARDLANAIVSKRLSLKTLASYEDQKIRESLKSIKGIGDWTVDIYMIHALRKLNIFPVGDLALMNSIKEIKKLSPTATREEIVSLSKKWEPYRTIATMILWHAYIKRKGIKIYD